LPSLGEAGTASGFNLHQCGGLLHGFGFASALADVGLPRGDIPPALFAFNVGIEPGQLGFIAAVLTLRGLVRRLPIPDRCELPDASGCGLRHRDDGRFLVRRATFLDLALSRRGLVEGCCLLLTT
jgi:hypothetical protein